MKERNDLKRLMKKFNKQKKFGPKNDQCCVVYRVKKSSDLRISNPFYKTYPPSKYLERNEPSQLRPYQVAFIVNKGWLPQGKDISHICNRPRRRGRKNKKLSQAKCINVDHMEVVSNPENCSRQKCHNIISDMFFSKMGKNKKMITECWKIDSCEHTPKCFIHSGL